MYNVTEEYMEALKKPSHKWKLRGTIGNAAFTEANVLTGSLSAIRQCSEGSEVKIGSVYISQLKGTFLSVPVDRNTWYGSLVEIEEGLETENGYEYVPIGIFIVDEATYTAAGVQITAYDMMSKLDRTFPADTTQGTAWSIYSLICHDCGVVPGMTQAQIEALPNGNTPLSLYADNDIETYRDVLSWLAQTLGCFAYADRDGTIKLKQYGSGEVDSLGTYRRFKTSKFSDFITKYTGVSIVDMDDQKTRYYSVTPDDGLTYNLGSNPFLQYGTESTKTTMREAVLGALQNIQYSPFEVGYSSLCVYDLGDVLKFPGGLGGGSTGCVMYHEWKYGRESKIKGFGQNPALANARSKTDKDIAGLISNTDKNGIQYYTFMNSEEINVGNNRIEPVISIRFTTMETTKVTWNAEVLCDANTQATLVCEAMYECNGSIREYKPTETWINGKHILSLWMVIEVEPNTQYSWVLYLKSTGGTIHIGIEEARAAIWGQGLVSIKEWNGYIDVRDTVEPIGLDDISVKPLTITAAVGTVVPHSRSVEDTFGGITLDDIAVAQFEDYVIMNKTSIYLEGMKWEDVYENTWGAIYDEHTW